MPGIIADRFQTNLGRVSGFLSHYDAVTDRTRGRGSIAETDLLRAAVVFLHAALEDLLRSIAEERYPSASPEVLGRFPLIGSSKTNFTLKELAAYRDQTVAEVLGRSVAAALERTSFNNVGDIVRLLEETDLPKPLVDPHRGKLAALMSRRHLIAHRADRNDLRGKGQHAANSIAKSMVVLWSTSVKDFGTAILEHLQFPDPL